VVWISGPARLFHRLEREPARLVGRGAAIDQPFGPLPAEPGEAADGADFGIDGRPIFRRRWRGRNLKLLLHYTLLRSHGCARVGSERDKADLVRGPLDGDTHTLTH
jgi:hypothetical protein